MRTDTGTITTMDTDGSARVRLLQLVSPALPVGGFSYSQGLEWAVERGWVRDPDTLAGWLRGLLDESLARLDLPVLARLYRACEAQDLAALERWSSVLLAARETAELRAEEHSRGQALAALLTNLGVVTGASWHGALARCHAAGFACASVAWAIALEDAALGYAWGWLENQVSAALRLVPLGQSDGQRVLLELGAHVPRLSAAALALNDDDIGVSMPALAIASSAHESQYTRLFRS